MTTTTYRGLEYWVGQRQKWTGVVQAGSGDVRLMFFGPNVPATGAIGGLAAADGTVVNVVGTPFYDVRYEGTKGLGAFYVEEWAPGDPLDYLTDTTTGLPSGVQRAGAAAAFYRAALEAAATGQDPNSIVPRAVQEAAAIEQQAVDAGKPVGPGGGANTASWQDSFTTFQAKEAERLAAERAAIASGGGQAAPQTQTDVSSYALPIVIGVVVAKIAGVF